ncbi:MAG: hypothetical protein K2J83_03045 [Clostridia bacterium]|nr:hypothetical protein [Clostridia bacterium]
MKFKILIIAMYSITCISILTAIVLMILHFTVGLESFWYTIPVGICAVSNLIAAILNLKNKNKDKDKKSIDIQE